jgi:hypothetical protein
MSDLKQIGFRLPAKLIESLDKHAVEIGGTRTDVITRLLEEGIARVNNGDTVIQRQTAVSREEIEDAFSRLAAPLIQRIEALENQKNEPAPTSNDKVAELEQKMQAIEKLKVLVINGDEGQRPSSEDAAKLKSIERATAILTEALTMKSNNGAPIKQAIQRYLAAVFGENNN